MDTEEEAREAANGKEVQVEAVDLATAHLPHLDSKLSSHKVEIKDEAKLMDSTEGILTVSEDQVLEKAPSVVEIPPEHTPNGTPSSLNGHMDEEKISDEKLQANEQKEERVEASPDRISTDQSNNSNGGEEDDSLGHGESTTEDTNLLKHENEEHQEHDQQDLEGDVTDEKMGHKDTLKTDNDVEATIDAPQGQNLESARATEDRQPANMPCIPGDEVVPEAPVGVQTSVDPNVEDSDALPDTSDGNMETVELAKVDKESCPEDEDIAEHTNESVKLEDQPSKQTDDVDADVVQEDIHASKNIDVPEDMSKTEQADELMNGDQEVLNQESSEETSDPVCEKTEENSCEGNMATSEETTPEHDATTREPALDIQEMQNQESVEEMPDAKEVDTEKTMQQSSVAFEEAVPKDDVATTKPSSDTQHVNVESEEIKGLEDAKDEQTSDQSNVPFAEDAVQDKEVSPTVPTEDTQEVQGLEDEETKCPGTVEIEASNQTHAEEDGIAASEPHVTELKEEVKDTEATETQEIPHLSHAAPSEELVTQDNSAAIEPHNDDIQQNLEQGLVEVKDTGAPETQGICQERTISASEEDTVEDDVTAEGPTCDAREVKNVESAEEIKDNTAENIVEASNVPTVEEADQEINELRREDISEQKMQGLEPEEIKNTGLVETEEASDQGHAALFSDPAQEDVVPRELLKTESTVEVKEAEASKTKAIPQESHVSVSEEPASEENIKASDSTCDTQHVNIVQLAEHTEGNKDTRTEEVCDQTNVVFVGEAAQGTNDLPSEPIADMQLVQGVESEEEKNAELTDNKEVHNEEPTQEDNLTTSELLVMEPAEASSNEATEGQLVPQSNVTQLEDQETEENRIVGETLQEPEPDEELKETEATEPTSEESVPEGVTAKEPASDNKEVHNEEPELIKEHDDEKTEEISNQNNGTIVGETAQENKLLASDSNNDVQARELKEIGDTEDVGSEEACHQTHAEERLASNEPEITEPSAQMTGVEATRPEPILHESNVVSQEEIIQQRQEQESVEFRNIEDTEPQGLSTSVGSTSDQSTPEDNLATEPNPDTQAENLEPATVTEDTEDVKSNVGVDEEKTPEEHVQAFEATVDMVAVEEPKLEDTKNTEPVMKYDNITANDLPAEEVKDTEAMEIREIHKEDSGANIGDLLEDAKSNVGLAEEATSDENVPATEATSDEHVPATEATVDIPPAQKPEEIKNIEPVEVEDNITATDQPAEEVNENEAMETEAIPHEIIDANISELTEDVNHNVALADETAPEDSVLATDGNIDIPEEQEPKLEEIKNTEPAEVESNIIATDLPAEEVTDTEAMKTEATPHESTDANSRELTEDVKSNAALADEAAPEEHAQATEATAYIPQAQEPQLEEMKNTEPVEMENNIAASDLPAEEMKDTEAMEIEAIPHEGTDEDINELTKNVKSNVALPDEAASDEHVLATEATVDIPTVQKPEEIKNVEVEDNITASDQPAEEVKDTDAKETEAIPHEITDAKITEDVKSNDGLADETAPEESVLASEGNIDTPRVQEPEPEEIKNTEPVEVKGNITASDMPEEEVTDTEAMETKTTPHESIDANISEHTEDVKGNAALADEAAPEEQTEATADILRAQEPELEEIKNTEPVEMEDNITASDLPVEEMKDTEAMETEAIPRESTDENINELIEDVKSNAVLADESTVDIPPAQEPELEEIKNTEPVKAEDNITANDLPAEEIQDTEAVGAEKIPQESAAASIQEHNENTILTANAPLADIQTNNTTTETNLEAQEDESAEEVEDIKVMETEQISLQDNITTTKNAAQESSELVKNGATLEEPTAEDNAANEIDASADAKQEYGEELSEGNKDMDDNEAGEASRQSQDAGLEPGSESNIATIQPTSDIQPASEAEEIMSTEAINNEEISCQETELAILEDPSPIDKGTAAKEQPVESNEEKKGESATEEDDTQISAEDTRQVTAEASQDSVENDAPDVAEKDDAMKSGDHTDDQDNKQHHDVVLQMQVCERAMDALATEQQDEAIQNVNLDQHQKEDEEIEKQTEEIQTVEQKDNMADFTTEPLLEPQSTEISTTDRKEDTDVFQAEQIETVATEMLENKQTLHIPKDYIPSITGAKVENSKEIKGTEEEDAANNAGSLYADAENYNEDEQENTEKDAQVQQTCTDEQDETSDETINEENHAVIPKNVESGVHREEKECKNMVNDDEQAIQPSEKEVTDEVEEKQEMQNEDVNVHHDEFQTKPEDEEAPEMHPNKSPYSADIKMHDIMSPYAETVHGRTDAEPTEIEEKEENKGFNSISEYSVETSKQNDVEQDLSIHQKVAEEKLAAEHNGAEAENDSKEEMKTGYAALTEVVKFNEAIYDEASGADEPPSDENLETFEDNRRSLEASSVVAASGETASEEEEHHKLALPAHTTLDGNTTEQASGLEETERGMLSPEKPFPTEKPEELEETQMAKEQDEEDIHEQEIGGTEKEEKESDLPVSHFLMNLIMGKENNDPDGNTFEAEKKQEETTKDDSGLITSQQEESLVPIPTENKVDEKSIGEQEKQNLEIVSEETHDVKLETGEELSRNTHDLESPVCQNNPHDESIELVPGEAAGLVTEIKSRDLKLGEKATDSVCQEHVEATADIEEGSLKSTLDDSTSPKTSQEHTLEEGRTDLQHESLPENRSSEVADQTLLSTELDMGDEKKFSNDTDDLESPLSTRREGSAVIGEKLENEVDKEEENQHTTTGGATEEQIEILHDNSQKGTGSEETSDKQTPKITEPASGTEISLVHEKKISAGSECMDEKQNHKFSNNVIDNSEKALEIQSDSPSMHMNQDKKDESADNQIVEKNLLDKTEEPNLQEQETGIAQKNPKKSDEGDQNFLTIREPMIQEDNVNRTVESHVKTVDTISNEEQGTFNSQVQARDLDLVSPKEAHEAEENFVEMARPTFSTDEEQSLKKAESNEEKTCDKKTQDEEEAKNFTDDVTLKTEEQVAVQKASHNQKHDLDAISPKEAPATEENFVDIKKEEFSTDEEQSPKKDGSNMAEEKSYDERTKSDEEAKNFTDEGAMKVEEREAGQKASPKKHNILSGVGSKVKHQLAKVKKAIIGKPGHTKSESPKS
ncbi:hypothetical protein BRADI_3g02910v3 [Brachypodium distachyon]|uniref:Uncharacterized protein n=1 Tax=Brachypodium distachyon TaxID=15368 RepID=A0A2K2CUU8_BRADI|nr:hypothetical protein BRADI_3g02910v3 [Brachypodium distachyon]